MVGAVAGDIIGSVYEHRQPKVRSFPLFHPLSCYTDDTVLSLAVAEAITTERPYAEALRESGRRHPRAGYGGNFYRWLMTDDAPPYRSWGNGAPMRVPAVGWAYENVEDVLREAEASAAPTHNHPEGIKGAQAVALSVYLARTGATKGRIKDELEKRFAYDLSRPLDSIRPNYTFDVSSQGSVPEAISCFLQTESWEDAVREAVWLGGDSDTIACMAGSIAEAFYGGVPRAVAQMARQRLTDDLLEVLDAFEARFGPRESAGGAAAEVAGPLKTADERLSTVAVTKAVTETEDDKASNAFLGSDYFEKHVGVMESENTTDFGDLKRVEVEEVDDESSAPEADVVPLEDLYSTDATQAREERRELMRKEGRWFHDNGREVEEGKHLVVARRSRILEFLDYLRSSAEVEACIPDYLLFLDILNGHESLLFFLRTADQIHVDLTSFEDAELRRATVNSGGRADRKEAVETSHMSLWLVNRAYWLEDQERVSWYAADPAGARKLLRDRVPADRIYERAPGL